MDVMSLLGGMGLIAVGVVLFLSKLGGLPYLLLGGVLTVGGCTAALLRGGGWGRFRRVSHDLALGCVLVGVCVLFAVLGHRFRERWDLTESSQYTLSRPTREVLDSLEKEVTLVSMYRTSSPAQIKARDLLEEYAAASPKVSVEYVDPDRTPSLVARHGGSLGRPLAVTCGPRRRLLRRANERTITAAIRAVAGEEPPRLVVFTAGHGERALDRPEAESHALAAHSLQTEGYRVALLSLAGSEVPSGTSLVIVGSPRSDLTTLEAGRLEGWLDGGGSALIMLDPTLPLPRLNGLLARRGIAVGPARVIDINSHLATDLAAPVVATYPEGSHPILEHLQATCFPDAAPITVTREGVSTPPSRTWPLAVTSTASAAQPLEGGEGPRGALALAAALEYHSPGKRSRLVVVGDADFASDALFGHLGNGQLFVNCVSWLTEDTRSLGIPVDDGASGTRVLLHGPTFRAVMALTLVGLPLILLIPAVYQTTRRRR